MDSRKQSHKGPRTKKQQGVQLQRHYYGLWNEGATCYLNSVLQVLFMTPEVHDRLEQDHRNESLDSKLMTLFKDLRIKTSGTETITEALGIRNVLQRDAAEFLELILHKLSTQVSEFFQGKLTYTTKCTKGHMINEETEAFWTLPLSLGDSDDKTYSVEEGFDAFFQPKSYSEGNMVYCNICGKKTEATRRCEMDQSPQILILLLKRFECDYRTMSHVKSNRWVDVSETLQVKTKQQKRKQYKLYGMVNHMGRMWGGHYTATIKSREDETWFEFNDSSVKKVQGNMFENQRTYISNTAYLLTYRAVEPQSPCDARSEDLSERVLQKPGFTDTHHSSSTLKKQETSKMPRRVNYATEVKERDWIAVGRDNEEVRKNRSALSRVIDHVKCCVSESALRDKHESDGSSNRGLDDLVAPLDKVFEEHLKIATVSKGTLETGQDELLDCILAVTKESIMEEVKSARFVAVQAHVTTDVPTQVQLVLVLRYIDRNHEVQERFFDVLPISDATSELISNAILETLRHLFDDDEKGKLIAQAYDGAIFKRGVDAAVQQKVRKYYKNAHHMHSYAHQLNLDMRQATSRIPEARVFFSDFEGIAPISTHSPERHSILRQLVEQRVSGASTTECDFNWRTVNTVHKNRDALIQCFQSIRISSSSHSTVREASNFIRMLQDVDFQFFLKLFHQIMSHVDVMDQELQKRVYDIVSIKRALEEFRRSVQTMRDQVRRRSNVSGRQEERRLTEEVCKEILVHTEERLPFTTVTTTDHCLPHCATLLQYYSSFPTEALDATIRTYSMLNRDKLKRELSNIHRSSEFKSCSGALELYQTLMRFNYQETFPETLTLLNILITIPTTTTKAERCFSTFKRIKTSLQNARRHKHVNALVMLSMERELVGNMADFSERVVDRFAALKERRAKFQYK